MRKTGIGSAVYQFILVIAMIICAINTHTELTIVFGILALLNKDW